jgi:6-phosphofructokinase
VRSAADIGPAHEIGERVGHRIPVIAKVEKPEAVTNLDAVIVAFDEPITVDDVKQVLEQELGEDARVMILEHVQRGGAPSAFDRYLSTLLGHVAVEQLLAGRPDAEPQLVGLRGNRQAGDRRRAGLHPGRPTARRPPSSGYISVRKSTALR